MISHAPPNGMPVIPADPTPGEYIRLAREIATNERSGLEPLRVAILGSSTLEFVRPALTVEGARVGFDVDLFVGDFGQLEQALLDEKGALLESERDVLVLAFQPGDLAPDAIDRFYATNGERLDTLCTELTDRLVGAAVTFRGKTGRPVLIANYAVPAEVPLGPFDAGDPNGVTHKLAAHNAKLTAMCRREPGVFVWDYAGLVGTAGASGWRDSRLHLLARVAVSSEGQPHMAKHLIRSIAALRRRPAKCLVLDLDNTLWGGVVGDDGLTGLQLGDDWPGNAYKAFQRVVLGLRDRGVLLAVASKNDEALASRVFREHPEMLIGWSDLAATRINWDAKSVNMRSIAEELNIGIDALVLFDDNPVERAEVRAALPEAGVIEVPSDPARYREALISSRFFDQPSLSAEDRDRAQMYQVERQRTTLREQAATLEEFLHGLEMEAEIVPAGPDTLGRIAQLIGKTNQFNLTTRRHSSAEIARMAAADHSVVAALRLRDRFGDQGLIAVGIVERRGEDAWVDTLLMSCRVMNRGVERALVAYLLECARGLGCSTIIGEYRPTARNHMVENLFPDLGFGPRGESGDGACWALDLESVPDLWPSYIRRVDGVSNPVGSGEKS
jgi:FkbH-like protein